MVITFNNANSSFISGRASATPSLDLFITLLSLGCQGYKELLVQRKELYQYLQYRLQECATQNGERLLDVRHNPISLGVYSFSSLIPYFFGVFPLPKQSQRSRSVLLDGSRSSGLFLKRKKPIL